jgi:hypothetical protein
MAIRGRIGGGGGISGIPRAGVDRPPGGASQNDTSEAAPVGSRSIGAKGLRILGTRIAIPQRGRSKSRHAPVLKPAAELLLLLLLLPLLAEQPDHIVEGLLHVDAVLRRGLDELTAQLLRQGGSFLGPPTSPGPGRAGPTRGSSKRPDSRSPRAIRNWQTP